MPGERRVGCCLRWGGGEDEKRVKQTHMVITHVQPISSHNLLILYMESSR